MKKILALVLLLTIANTTTVQDNSMQFTEEDWKLFRSAMDVFRFTWTGFIRQFYRKVHAPITVSSECFGPWIDSDIKLISEVMEQLAEFDILNLNYTETKEAANAAVDLLFKQDEVCHFRQFIIDTQKYCEQPTKPCDPNNAIANMQTNAMDIISKVIQISELISKTDTVINPTEIEETSTTIGEAIGGIISDIINFH